MSDPNPNPTPSAIPTQAELGRPLFCGAPGCNEFVTWSKMSRTGRRRRHDEIHKLVNVACRGEMFCAQHIGIPDKIMRVSEAQLIVIGRGTFGTALEPGDRDPDRLPSDALFAYMGRSVLLRGHLGIEGVL